MERDNSSSGAESDGGGGADTTLSRVHPTVTSPPPTPLHGFACEFARRRCGHEDIFHPHYTRTNLRKGDKILRCFPHCCPDHVSRSFCGASLHVDVHWDASTAVDEAATLPEVIVFARFRVKDSPGLSVGGHVTRHEISQSLQNESNPHGEWIAARVVSSSSSHDNIHAWLFEVNHDARWYYHWESGVAKRHRLKHHVLDVFVLLPSSLGSSDVDINHRPLQVMATIHSPPFRLISFRRATPKAVQALAGPRIAVDAQPVVNKRRSNSIESTPSIQNQQSVPSSTISFKRQHHDSPEPLLRPPVRTVRSPQLPFGRDASAGLHRGHEYTARPSFADLATSMDSRPHHYASSSEHFSRFPPLALPQPRAATQSTRVAMSASLPQACMTLRLQRLLACLDCLQIDDAIQHMNTFHRVHTAALARITGIRLGALSTGVSPAHAMQDLLAHWGVRVHTCRPRPSTALTTILCELLLWLSFDVDLHGAMRSTFAQEASTVFVSSRLRATFIAFAEWLERHVDAFLQDRGWRLEDVVEGAAALSPVVDDTLNDPYEAFGNGLRCVVAQLSECFIQQTTKRAAPVQGHKDATSLTGEWRCAVLQGGLHVRALSPTSDASLFSLFTLVRELGAVCIRVDGHNAHLTLASLFNTGGQHSGSQFVLDGRSHWLRAFPSGIATSSLSVGGLWWGDYVGEVPQQPEIKLRLYAWHAPQKLLVDNAGALGVCVRVRLWFPQRDTLVLQASVSRAVVDTASAQRMGLHSVDAVRAQLPYWPLERKQQLVRSWEPAFAAEMRYARVHRPLMTSA